MRLLPALLALLAAASGCAAPRPAEGTPVRSCGDADVPVVRAVTAEAADVPPAPVGGDAAVQQHIEYPDAERRAGAEGDVLVRFVVSAEGDVVCSDAVRSVSPALDRAARRAVHASRFQPAQLGGRPVAAVVEYPVGFRLR